MPRYRRWRRQSASTKSGPVAYLTALMVLVVVFCAIFALLSQPGAFKFTLGQSPTPTPFVASPASPPGSSWIALLLFLAVLLGGGGLVILSLIWFISWAARSSRAAPSTPPKATFLTQLYPPVTPTANMATDVTPIRQAPVTAFPTVPEPVVAVQQEPGWAVETSPLMTGLERSFFWALRQVVQEGYYIFPQIPLRELVGTHQRNAFTGNLSGMFYKGVVDFLLVNPNTLQVALACEFDDPSHRQVDAHARDRRKEEFLRQIGISLIRVQSNRKWNLDWL